MRKQHGGLVIAQRVAIVGALSVLGILAAASVRAEPQSDRPCVWTGKYSQWIYRERQLISTYAVPSNLDAARKLLPAPFQLAEKPLVRISVLDLYDMKAGPPYHESDISLLVRHRGELGWFIVALPVTDEEACGGGVIPFGFPKYVRKVTLDREGDRYVGVVYQHGAEKPELTLQLLLDESALDAQARAILDRVSRLPSYTIKKGVVNRFNGFSKSIYELKQKSPNIFDVKFGVPTLDVQPGGGNVLESLGVSTPRFGFWLRMHYEFSLNPKRFKP
jgi:acetoacetate decarboxylase